MTTRVTIDAHAGWPVHVVLRHGEADYEKTFTSETVEPNTQRDFYLHSGQSIVHVEEGKR